MRFYGKNKYFDLGGTNICGIRFFGASLDDAGSWGCMIDYHGWRDYGVDNEWCTAAASAWLEVETYKSIIIEVIFCIIILYAQRMNDI